MNNRLNFRFICLLLAIGYCALLNVACDKKTKKIDTSKQSFKRQAIKPRVTITYITPQDVVYIIEAVGSLEADVISIPAKVSGAITKLSFREGDYVKKNHTILAEIDSDTYEIELQKAGTQVEIAKAQVKIALAKKKQSQIIYKKAKIDYQKRRELYKKNIVTAEELLSFKTVYNQTKANIKEIKASIEQAIANLEQMKILYKLAQKNFKDSKTISPINGVIQSKNVTIGQYVRPDTIIATIVDMDNLYLKFNVSQSEATLLNVGKKINFTIPPQQTDIYVATIFYISQYANPTTHKVEIRANNIQPIITSRVPKNNNEPYNNSLRPGYFANVSIETDIHKNAIVIPSQAVLTTEKGNIAFILEGKTVRERKIELGHYTKDGKVEVLSGINANETLVVLGANVLQDGMEVEPINQ